MNNKYEEVFTYAEKLWLTNTPQYKKLKKLTDNFNEQNDKTKNELENTLLDLLVMAKNKDENKFRNNFGF